MKTLCILAFLLLSYFNNACFAQNEPNQPKYGGERRSDFQPATASTLQEYKAISGRADRSPIEKLEEIRARGLEQTPENLAELLRLVDTRQPSDQKAALLRILPSFHTKADSMMANAIVESYLRKYAASADKSVAAAALLAYTRLGYFPDTQQLLDRQLIDGYISTDDAFGELAHVLLLAPPSEQLKIIMKLENSRNKYAIDIVASDLKTKESRANIPIESKIALQKLLEQNPPEFSVATGEFSLKEAIMFSDWLHALACITGENTKTSYDEVILMHLDSPTSNPKKLISFFSSPEGKAAAQRIGKKKLAGISLRIANFANTLPYPQNSTIREFAASVIGFTNSLAQ